jgi:arylformamidase
LGTPERPAYGSTPIEALDVYRTGRADAPIHIHIHGGEWRLGTVERSAFAAAQ